MISDVADALGAGRYAHHALCLTDDPIMLFLYAGADVATFLSFLAISLALLAPGHRAVGSLVRYRASFGCFILLCGLSHLTMALVLFEGIYRLDVGLRVATASVSVTTAIFVVKDFFSGGRR